MSSDTQEDTDAAIRTRGLAILARILAASIMRKETQCHDSSDNAGPHINPLRKDTKEHETSEGASTDQ